MPRENKEKQQGKPCCLSFLLPMLFSSPVLFKNRADLSSPDLGAASFLNGAFTGPMSIQNGSLAKNAELVTNL